MIDSERTKSSVIADKLRALFCKVVEVLQDFLSENVDKKFTTDYNVVCCEYSARLDFFFAKKNAPYKFTVIIISCTM